MKAVIALLVGGAVLAGTALVLAAEKRQKGGGFSVLLGSQKIIENTDANLNKLEQDFGIPLESVATRYLSTTKNGTLLTVLFLPSASTPALPKSGATGTTASGVPYRVVSATLAPVA